jgi:hypothetical protein
MSHRPPFSTIRTQTRPPSLSPLRSPVKLAGRNNFRLPMSQVSAPSILTGTLFVGSKAPGAAGRIGGLTERLKPSPFRKVRA